MAQTFQELLKSRRLVDTDFKVRFIRFFQCPTTHVAGGEGGWVVDSAANAPSFPAIGDTAESSTDSTLENFAFSSAGAPSVASIDIDPRSTRKVAIFKVVYDGTKIWEN